MTEYVVESTENYESGNSLEKSKKPMHTELQSLNTHSDEFTDHLSTQTRMLINNSEISEAPAQKISSVEGICEGASNDFDATGATDNVTSGIRNFSSLERFKLTLSFW